jgi:hypothetical protein
VAAALLVIFLFPNIMRFNKTGCTRDKDGDRRISAIRRGLYVRERRAGQRGARLVSAEFVRNALYRFGARSIISGKTEGLQLRRFCPDLPLDWWNVAVVTTGENEALSHERRVLARFPPDFAQRMQAMRRLWWASEPQCREPNLLRRKRWALRILHRCWRRGRRGRGWPARGGC